MSFEALGQLAVERAAMIERDPIAPTKSAMLGCWAHGIALTGIARKS
jgi:hypothetical protein